MGDLPIEVPNGEASTKVVLRDVLHTLDLGLTVVLIGDIVSSSAPEVTSSYVTIWVRVGVNRARALYDTVVSRMFCLFPLSSGQCFPPVSLSFHTIPVPSVSRHSVEHSRYSVQYIRLKLPSLGRQVESPVQ